MKAILSNIWIRVLLIFVLGIVFNRFLSNQFDRFNSGWQLAIMSVFVLLLTVVVVAGIIRSEKRREQR